MNRTANRIGRLGMAGSVALLVAMPAYSAIRSDQPVQGWSAMAGIDTASLLQQAQDMPTSDMAVGDQPYCATDSEIHQTLTQDFSENRVDAEQHAGTELWGSDQMGTWTLVAPRKDNTSCIIASGIGFDEQTSVEVYYTTAGLQ
ncbi:hypothetical protein H4P12_06055 [Paracoccus sp. 11-3]|uniref:Uncharacterized protein n=1 Tax=Paracoccus amoyensis TaxID=2760093 RepID=A0A926GBX9_9RHOB|nr:hypothetical protein [Paracoccus amoyensis]MBC9246285.1 hypothetical protein [Paracoccus amoyensis]